MATIQPFRGIRPNPLYADQLDLTKPQAESVAGDNSKEGSLKPLKTLLETGARHRPESPEAQELAYREIKDTLHNLLKNQQLSREQYPCIYIYEVVHPNYRQTGVWALTSLQDYRNGNIKIHELTFDDSIRRMKNYRENTGLEGSPVLLTYPPDITINRIIAETKASQPVAALGGQTGWHLIWRIEERKVKEQLIAAFARVKTVYLADGHHRLGSAEKLAGEQSEKGNAVFDAVSSLYMATDQLRIEEYNRVVIPGGHVDKTALLKDLSKDFDVSKSADNMPVQPKEALQMGMCMEGSWYRLLAKPHTYLNQTDAANFDAAILQELVLAPLFGITDPKNDTRLKYAGGEKAMEEVTALLNEYPGAIAFTLPPLPVAELIKAADAGQILPPKSTWVVPKLPYGLIMHLH